MPHRCKTLLFCKRKAEVISLFLSPFQSFSVSLSQPLCLGLSRSRNKTFRAAQSQRILLERKGGRGREGGRDSGSGLKRTVGGLHTDPDSSMAWTEPAADHLRGLKTSEMLRALCSWKITPTPGRGDSYAFQTESQVTSAAAREWEKEVEGWSSERHSGGDWGDWSALIVLNKYMRAYDWEAFYAQRPEH